MSSRWVLPSTRAGSVTWFTMTVRRTDPAELFPDASMDASIDASCNSWAVPAR